MFRVFRGQKTYARADDVGDDDQKNERERERRTKNRTRRRHPRSDAAGLSSTLMVNCCLSCLILKGANIGATRGACVCGTLARVHAVRNAAATDASAMT